MRDKHYLIENETLMQEWYFIENEKLGLFPEKLSLGNDSCKPYWKCKECGHIWQAVIYHRNKGKGCPKCAIIKRAKSRLLTMINKSGSVSSKYPEWLNEWDYEKNIEVNPENLTHRSNKKVWWKCNKCGNEWQSSPNERARGRGCPHCGLLDGAKKQKATKLKKTTPLAISHPELLNEWDWEKNNIDPYTISAGNHYKAHWICGKCNNQWQERVYARKKGSGCPYCSNVKKYSLPEKIIYFYIKKQFIDAVENYKPEFLTPKELDIFIPSQKVAIEYDGERYHKDIQEDLYKNKLCKENGIELIRIREPKCPNLSIGSNYIMSTLKDYLGAIKYVFQYLNQNTSITQQDVDNDIIDVLASIRTNELENSLAAKYPNLVLEWDFDRNGNLLPEKISTNSNIKVNWICRNGHHFQMVISKRTARNQNCPYCSGRIAIVGENDITTLRPDLKEYWDTEKNVGLIMENYKINSGKTV